LFPIEANVTLTQPRKLGASVVINGGTTLWITGGQLVGNKVTNLTEFVELNGTRNGPDMPLALNIHCLVSLNDTTVILIGGNTGGSTKTSATFFYNIEHQTWYY
jgi:hypothetical protein